MLSIFHLKFWHFLKSKLKLDLETNSYFIFVWCSYFCCSVKVPLLDLLCFGGFNLTLLHCFVVKRCKENNGPITKNNPWLKICLGRCYLWLLGTRLINIGFWFMSWCGQNMRGVVVVLCLEAVRALPRFPWVACGGFVVLLCVVLGCLRLISAEVAEDAISTQTPVIYASR